MERLASYVSGAWVHGSGKASVLVNPTTEEPIAEASTEGIDFAGALAHARDVGGPALRALSFAQRGELLLALSRAIHANRDALIEVAIQNGGNTRSDAKFDIDGASGTLAYYAELGKQLGDARFLVDGEGEKLGRSPRFFGYHVLVPRAGVAVHINAFNFPAWGLAEKAACALLAGMPVVSKPATSTALLAYRIARLFVEANILPAGAFSFIAGAPGDMLDHLGGQDVLAFTGSADTGARLRAMPAVVHGSVRLNIEADSLNTAVLGPDVTSGSDTYRMFLREVTRDITQKAGQKCTAIRRILVPRAIEGEIKDELVSLLRDIKVGDPALEGVTVGPLATAAQLRDIRAGIQKLSAEASIVLGDGAFERVGAQDGKGYFVPPTLLHCKDPDAARDVHQHEVFGPCATIVPYDGSSARATDLVRRGGGMLVGSVYSDDRAFVTDMIFGLSPYHGRLYFGSEKIADQTPGPGTVLPQSVHGGPGRAGGGEELGGRRGLAFYSHRAAIQGARPILEAALDLKS
ncbi:3,4-dehydroadipyl-CoA semialdehyde dehydrogenase [Polyangium sp. y55x31]|uniref:3,4-dehydroadipyl-CoA semialdehyde dehydrogenase n=1 Tax=Polyangium sp. y55x31 TaxID=3042688 RepID=UPI00248300B5|nr:3,4-dehydroadipyl-CoA semialdehyde dehydrogenase [Polyangium sp. y55x31]MDI1479020.1 3,4-dehydroadipyl-CoA semialdehyde dehydrogenase [Polyangium sp. y55x31]